MTKDDRCDRLPARAAGSAGHSLLKAGIPPRGAEGRGLTRRRFCGLAAQAAAGVALQGCLAEMPTDEGFAATAILRSADYGADLPAVIEQGLALVPPPPAAGKRVVLKVNLVDLPREGRPVVTHPAVVAAVAESFRRRGASEVIVADGPALQRDAHEIADACGLTTVLREHRLPFVDLNLDDLVRLSNGGGATGFEWIFVAATAARADLLVSLPKLKTHHWAGASVAMKNLFGITPASVYGWPRNRFHIHGMHEAVFDFNRTRPADYCVVDGIVAMEGDGPVRGTARALGVLVFGDNAAAVDATCARVMGLRPERIAYLRMAAGTVGPVGEASIEQRGESIASVSAPFAVVQHLEQIRG